MSSVLITFTTQGDSGKNWIVELDEKLNGGKSTFAFGEKAYFKVFSEKNATPIVVSSDGTVTAEGDGVEDVEETVEFIDSQEAFLSKPCVNIKSTMWFGNSLGNITLESPFSIKAEKEPQISGNGVAIAKITYTTTFRRFAISIPSSQFDEHPVLIVVAG